MIIPSTVNSYRFYSMFVNFCKLPTFRRRTAMASVLITLLGGTTVFIILVAQLTNALIDDVSTCGWVLIVGCVLLPLTWFGTPKDFWLVDKIIGLQIV